MKTPLSVIKNTIYYYLLLIMILSLNATCKSGDDFPDSDIIKGSLLEYGTNKPLADVNIIFNECEGEVLGEINCYKIEEFYTDENGEFYFDFSDVDAITHNIVVDPVEGYFNIQSSVINKGYNEVHLFADPTSFIQIQLKNINPYNYEDRLYISGSWGGGSSDNIFLGTSIDTVITRKVKGNRMRHLLWNIRKNGTAIIEKDSFHISAHDTINYEIYY